MALVANYKKHSSSPEESKSVYVHKNATHNSLDTPVNNPLTQTLDEPVEVARDTSGATPSYIIPPVPQRLLQASWVQPGTVVEIGSFRIKGGFIYVGESLLTPRGLQDVSLIDPKKHVANEGVFLERQTSFWHSYAEASPRARHAYLTWLTSDRDAPDADMGFVFWYLYGLERRVIFDLAQAKEGHQECIQIAQELRRLIAVYGKRSNNFRDFAQELLTLTENSGHTSDIIDAPVPDMERTWRYPLYVEIALGHCVKQQRPIPAHLAFAWVYYSPTVVVKANLKSALDTFQRLFEIRYSAAYGSGLSMELPNNVLKQGYRACSPSFRYQGEIEFTFDKVPRVTVRLTEFYVLKAIFEKSAEDLNAYLRFVSKFPDRKDTLEADLQMPKDWVSPRVQKALSALKALPDDDIKDLTTRELMELLGLKPEPLSKSYMGALKHVLLLADKAVYPELPPKIEEESELDSSISLYSWHAQSAPSQEELNVLTCLSSATLIGLRLLGAELSPSLAQPHVEAVTSTTSSHAKTWLTVTLPQVLGVKPTTGQFKKFYAQLSESQQACVFSALKAHVAQQGDVGVEALKALEKLYVAAGRDAKNMYSDVHRELTAPASTESTVLDFDRIKQLQEETAEVGILLGAIFEEPAQQESVVPVAAPEAPDMPASPLLEKLPEIKALVSPTQAQFLAFLLTQSTWDKGALESKSQELNVMLNGTLEALNEACFDCYDCPLFEGDDPIEISPEILSKL